MKKHFYNLKKSTFGILPILGFYVLLLSCSEKDYMLAEPMVSEEVSKNLLRDINGEEIFTTVEVVPEYPGGIEELFKFIGQEIKYPVSAVERGIEGRVFVKFVIDKEGVVQMPKILKGTYSEIDDEALRVVSKLPRWEPGKQNGNSVNTYFTMPIVFKLQ